jgi:mRNA interferase MazF
MRRGEVRLVDLDPVRGSEPSKRRPAIVVSNDGANAAARLGRGLVTVVPVTSKFSRLLRFQVPLPATTAGLRVDSKAQAEQLRSVSVERLGPAIGIVPPALMAAVDDALRLHLAL